MYLIITEGSYDGYRLDMILKLPGEISRDDLLLEYAEDHNIDVVPCPENDYYNQKGEPTVKREGVLRGIPWVMYDSLIRHVDQERFIGWLIKKHNAEVIPTTEVWFEYG